MILEIKMRSGSENLKRSSAKFGKCFPLKKRRINYEEELDLNSSSSLEPLQLDEPENLSTKPQDLRITSQVKLDQPIETATNTTNDIQIINPPLSRDDLNVMSELYPTKEPTPMSLNPTGWSYQSRFTPYSPRIQDEFYSVPNHHYKNEFILPYELPSPFRPLPTHSSPPMRHYNPTFHPPQFKAQVMRLSELGTVTHRITTEAEDTFRNISSRESVISHGNIFNNGQRDTVSRSSCDSGVSSPSSSSSHSTNCAPSITPTVVNGSVRYQCPTCTKSYSTVSGLSKHVQFHCTTQVPKSFVCKDCDKVYVSLGALKMHLRTHTLPCKCTICGKAFSRPWLLQGHLRTHTGEKPFSCTHCHRAFADRSNLRAHLQTHSQVKKYSCTNCAKTFSRMSLLTKHEESGCSAH